ncbi:toll/interleukin-1 receptor-like protein [Prunus persica]|nr:toll/interleukin-1 receptor-like protein [Prunus persica]
MALSSTQRASEQSTPCWKHYMFLSFGGEDTRKGFISHLYHELDYWQAIKTFKDNRDLEIGTSISPELLHAIEESQLAIIVLSPNYASSTWCLDELTKVVECMEARDTILPIFYGVDPSQVRNQTGSFAEAFTKHKEKLITKKNVEQWKADLTKVANLCGWDSRNFK